MHVMTTVVVSFTQLCNFNAKMTLFEMSLLWVRSNNVIFALKVTELSE